jgi:acyl-CoA dehydrogenase
MQKGSSYLELPLRDEARQAIELAHQFADEVLAPTGRVLDRMATAEEVIAPDSPFWEVHEKYRQTGLAAVQQEPSFTPSERALVMAAVCEELGRGDAGLAISLGVAGFQRFFVPMTGDPELIERFAAPSSKAIGCWAITEPDHGSDTLAISEPGFENPGSKANCVARRDGADWVITGQKSAWVSNAPVADVACLFCALEGGDSFAVGGVAVVPLDLPGVSRGKPLEKLGQRALPQGELFFDEVRIPGRWMVVQEQAYKNTLEMVLALANAFMGSTFSGVARSAFEHALGYAKERVQGGKVIFEHQSVRSRLFSMFRRVEAATALSRRVHQLAALGGLAPPVQFSIASKTFCTQTAFEVASDAVQIFGANGLTREYPVEKILRDARASMIEDGCNEVLSLVGASKL